MTHKEITEALTDELLYSGVLTSMIQDEEITDIETHDGGEEAYAEPVWLEIDPLDYTDDITEELIRRWSKGQIRSGEFKEAMINLGYESEEIRRSRAETERIMQNALRLIREITKRSAA